MSVWFCLPSCRPKAEAEACFAKWRTMGYRIAILRQGDPVEADLIIPTGHYLGWARSTNILCREVARRDPDMRWCVGGGDDYEPDLSHKAEVISARASLYFDGTLGVMQPTGDRWGDDAMSRARFGKDRGAYIDRVAGSPWLGREWIERSYLGNGPMYDGYHHLYADEELQEVATRLGVFWQCRELIQFHDHAMRSGVGRIDDWPEHLREINTPESWGAHTRIFAERKQKGFPGHELISETMHVNAR